MERHPLFPSEVLGFRLQEAAEAVALRFRFSSIFPDNCVGEPRFGGQPVAVGSFHAGTQSM